MKTMSSRWGKSKNIKSDNNKANWTNDIRLP